MREVLLRVEQLSVSLGQFKAVDELSYTLARGETLGVVGESGCGKTLAALALLGLTPAVMRRQGHAYFNHDDLLTLNEKQLRRLRGRQIAMIFQEPMSALNPAMTIGDQVAEMFVLHEQLTLRQARRQAADALARVRITDPGRCACQYPHQLSGGMRQRVMVAMALACRPQLLIADEPTTALDVTVQAQILDLIMEMQEEIGMAVLFISHNLGVICQIADRVMVMYAGKAVEIAPAEVLLHEPLHPYTLALLETLPRLGARRNRLPAIPGTVPPLGFELKGCCFADRCYRSDASCRVREPLLEEYSTQHQVACGKIITHVATTLATNAATNVVTTLACNNDK